MFDGISYSNWRPRAEPSSNGSQVSTKRLASSNRLAGDALALMGQRMELTLPQDGPETSLPGLIGIEDIPRLGAVYVPGKAAVIAVDQNRVVTYLDLHRLANRFAELVRDRGLRPGDRVGFVGRNSDLFLSVVWGTLRAQLVLVPINWRSAAPELNYVITDAEIRLLIIDNEFVAVAKEALEELEHPPALILTDGVEGLYQELSRPPATEFPSCQDANQTVLQLYTSGTTGRPKGVLISLAAMNRAREIELTRDIEPVARSQDDVLLASMPQFHIGGIVSLLFAMGRGLTCVITGDNSAQHLLDLAHRYAVSHTFIVPTVLKAVIDRIQQGHPRPRLKLITLGAAALSPELLREALAILKCGFGQAYGMTEACGSVTYLGPKYYDPDKPGLLTSVGKPQAGIDVEIRDPEMNVCQRGVAGEIWVRSPTLMTGYWKRQEETARSLRDGWYSTGDGGYLDDEGFLFLTDRIRDMIISGGENIYPAEVEAALSRHPAVQGVAVVGVPDELWGERVHAAVEIKRGLSIEPADLLRFARTQLAAFKCPKTVAIVEELPRTSLGKVQRAVIRDTCRAAANCATKS